MFLCCSLYMAFRQVHAKLKLNNNNNKIAYSMEEMMMMMNMMEKSDLNAKRNDGRTHTKIKTRQEKVRVNVMFLSSTIITLLYARYKKQHQQQ